MQCFIKHKLIRVVPESKINKWRRKSAKTVRRKEAEMIRKGRCVVVHTSQLNLGVRICHECRQFELEITIGLRAMPPKNFRLVIMCDAKSFIGECALSIRCRLARCPTCWHHKASRCICSYLPPLKSDSAVVPVVVCGRFVTGGSCSCC